MKRHQRAPKQPQKLHCRMTGLLHVHYFHQSGYWTCWDCAPPEEKTKARKGRHPTPTN